MEATFWHDRWQERTTPWEQADVHPMLTRRWGELGAAADSAVFVPLCGASVDMAWLAGQGHRVVGTELSEVAIGTFFGKVGLVPDVEHGADVTVFRAGPYELWCGDHFALPSSAVEGVGVVYDRASLVALPPDVRRRYAEHLTALLPSVATFLVTFVYDQSEMGGPPFSVPSEEVRTLFGRHDAIELVERDDALARSGMGGRLSAMYEELHLLRRPRPAGVDPSGASSA